MVLARRGRSSSSALVMRAALPTLVLALSRLQAVAAETAPLDDDGSGSSCDVLDTLCLDQIDHTAAGFILELFLFFWCFLALAIVCDDYLVASLETLCVRWSIREDVAGCTFMAFGSAAPEIIVNAVATIKAGNADTGSGSGSGGSSATDLGIAAIIGSGMIAFTLIPGLCGLFGPRREEGKEFPLLLKRRPLLRDVGTYSVGLLQLSLFFSDGEIHMWEASTMVGTYFAYVVLVITAPKIRRAWRLKHGLDISGDTEGLLQDKDQDGTDSEEEDWKQPKPCKRGTLAKRRTRPLVITDSMGRRVVFPPVPPKPDSAGLRVAFSRVLGSSVRVDSNAVQRAVQEDPEFKRMLVDAGVSDPSVSVVQAFGGLNGQLITPEGFESALAKEMHPAVFSIDGAEQQPVRSARLVLSHKNPRIELTPGQPISLAPDASCYRQLAQLERWLRGQPHVSCSLEYEQGAKVDGWFYDRYIPATVRTRHHNGTYDVDWDDGTFSEGIPFSDLAPPNIRQARNPKQEFAEHSQRLRECMESGALNQTLYQEALAELRERILGEGDHHARSPKIRLGINIPTYVAPGSPSRMRGGTSRAGTSRVGSPRTAYSGYSVYSGASTLSVWRRQWFKEDMEDEFKELPLWRWPFQLIMDFLVGFWQFVFRVTIPDTALAEEGEPPNPFEKYYPVAFILSFLWVAVFSFVISTIAGRWADLSGLGNGFFGLLLVSSGAEIPDCIQSITVAKRGFGSMATSNAIGSQNVNVLIGLGLPWLMYNAAMGKTVKVDGHKKLQAAAFFQCGAIALNVFLLIGLAVITGEKKAQLGAKKGKMLCAAYFVVLTGFALYDQLL
eukprot:Hpha_TRINITY_DN16818_c0_g12::TRINITY_DN16818_c0_g12_i1::g.148356::m.148356